MPHPQIEKWLQNEFFPQRVLLSGIGDLYQEALEIAAGLQETTVESLKKGLETDVLLIPDDGNPFRIGESSQAESRSARGIIHWISQKPVSPYRIVILERFERASRDAPQALLKILEEPPAKAIFLFTTQNHHQILDTICSRMTVINRGYEAADFEIQPEIESFLKGKDLISKFQIIDRLHKNAKEGERKKDFHDFCTKLLLHARFFQSLQPFLEDIFLTQQALARNQNAKLVMENLALKLTK